MKQTIQFLMMLAVVVLPACSEDEVVFGDDSFQLDGSTSGSSSTTSTSIGDLSSFDIAIDKTPLSEASLTGDDEDLLSNNTFATTVTITFSDNSYSVDGVVDGVDFSASSGADVIVSSTVSGINYVLTGTTSNGMFKVYSSKKYQLTLNGVSITNNDGPALNLQSGKRAYVYAADGTTNTLTDGTTYASSDEDQKGTVFSEGKLLFSGTGIVNVYGKGKNGIASDDYIKVFPGANIYVNATAGHGIKANDSILVEGGVINVETSATAAKGIKSDGLIQIDGGRTTVITTGNGEYDSEERDASGAAGVKTDSIFRINAGQLLCKSTGTGGKGIKTDQECYFNGGTVKVITTGKTYTYSSRIDAKAKGIKADKDLIINDGNIMVRATGGDGSEGIESKSVMTINGGTTQVLAYDDAINSASHLYIKGGDVLAYSTGNDGLDSNGNMYIQGGTTVAYGTRQPECGIDANEEGGYSVYFLGGNLFAIGGGNSTPSSSQSTQGYVTTSGSISAGTTATITSGSTTLASFSLPANYSSGSILVTANGMTAGNSYTLSIGSASATLSAVQYGGSGMGGTPGGGRPGGR